MAGLLGSSCCRELAQPLFLKAKGIKIFKDHHSTGK